MKIIKFEDLGKRFVSRFVLDDGKEFRIETPEDILVNWPGYDPTNPGATRYLLDRLKLIHILHYSMTEKEFDEDMYEIRLKTHSS